MAACDGIQDCLANGCNVDLAAVAISEIRKACGMGDEAGTYVEIRADEVTLDGIFTYDQIIRLAALLGIQRGL